MAFDFRLSNFDLKFAIGDLAVRFSISNLRSKICHSVLPTLDPGLQTVTHMPLITPVERFLGMREPSIRVRMANIPLVFARIKGTFSQKD